MADPEARMVGAEPPTNIKPLMRGEIRGEEYVLSANYVSGDIYVQFQGWIVEYSIVDLLEEAYAEVWGVTPEEDDIETDE